MIKNDTPTIQDELTDIMPSLSKYLKAKNKFKTKTTTQEGVNLELRKLVVEINEFLTVLYAHSTSPTEREILKKIKSF